MPKKKPKKTDISQGSSKARIKPTKLEPPQGISFSFRYFQDNNDKFSVKNKEVNYFSALFERLRDLSKMTFYEITVQNAKNLRCHPIDWDDPRVTETSFGIPGEEQLVDTPYQLFQLSSNEYGRVHGFFIENIFYIVWLDPNHRLYTSR